MKKLKNKYTMCFIINVSKILNIYSHMRCRYVLKNNHWLVIITVGIKQNKIIKE